MIVEASYIPVIEDYNKDGTLKLSAILKILENAGNCHSDSVGDNVLTGSNNGKAWASLPTKGSTMILNASAEKGASSEELRSSSFSPSLLVPFTGGISRGEGRNSTTASSRG